MLVPCCLTSPFPVISQKLQQRPAQADAQHKGWNLDHDRYCNRHKKALVEAWLVNGTLLGIVESPVNYGLCAPRTFLRNNHQLVALRVHLTNTLSSVKACGWVMWYDKWYSLPGSLGCRSRHSHTWAQAVVRIYANTFVFLKLVMRELVFVVVVCLFFRERVISLCLIWISGVKILWIYDNLSALFYLHCKWY